MALAQRVDRAPGLLLQQMRVRRRKDEHRRLTNPAEFACWCQAAGRLESGTTQLLDPDLLAVPQRVVHQQLLLLGAGVCAVQRFGHELLDQRATPRCPGHGLALQESRAYRLGLLLLALELELARFLRPLFTGRNRAGPGPCLAGLEPQQAKQRVACVGLDDGQALDRARHRHVQRVDVELVELERLVTLVGGAPVVELVAQQVLGTDALADLGVGRALARDQPQQQHMRVLQPLGLVHRENQRGAQLCPSRRLVLVAQHDHRMTRRPSGAGIELLERCFLGTDQTDLTGLARAALDQKIALAVDRAEARLLDLEQRVGQLGHRPGVAEIGPQHLQRLALRGVAGQALPEQRAHRGPGEEVWVHDLVGVPAQQELPWRLQASQHQRELHTGQVLHLVDHNEVVTGLGQGPPVVRNQVEVEQPGIDQPLPVAAEQAVRGLPRGRRQQALARPECKVVGQAQWTRGLGADHAAKLLEQRMGVDLAQRLGGNPVPVEPATEGVEVKLAASRDAQRLEKLAVAQELGLLLRVFVAQRAVQRTRRLRQEGRLGDVEHPASRLAQLGQGHRGLARAGRAHQHHWRGQPAHGFLCIVEDDGLVQQFELVAAGMQPAQRRGIGLGRARCRDRRFAVDLGLVHRRATQEARLVVSVVLDHLQRQAHRLAAVTGKLQQQAVAVVELGAVVSALVQLLDVWALEVIGLYRRLHLGKRRLDAPQV